VLFLARFYIRLPLTHNHCEQSATECCQALLQRATQKAELLNVIFAVFIVVNVLNIVWSMKAKFED